MCKLCTLLSPFTIGYLQNLEDSQWIARSIFNKSRTGTASHEILTQLRQLQAAGLVEITHEVARNVVYSLRGKPGSSPAQAAFEALVLMDFRGDLTFSLNEVCEEVVASWRGCGAVDESMLPLIQQVERCE